ncbi:unnamed protein product [Amoebophrya sp. A25]|nr:unnamed protein product [Amoebophrya sp. A25]|eukprot:GSA25T00027622001.1
MPSSSCASSSSSSSLLNKSIAKIAGASSSTSSASSTSAVPTQEDQQLQAPETISSPSQPQPSSGSKARLRTSNIKPRRTSTKVGHD